MPAMSPPPPRLLGAVHVLDDVGPIRRGRRHVPVALRLVPAGVFVVPLVVVPVLATVWTAVTSGADIGEVGAPMRRTLAWAVVLPLVVTLLGLLLAHLLHKVAESRLSRSASYVMVVPFAMPLVVTGVAFRILYHPDPDRGGATRVVGAIPGDQGWLGPGWISEALMLAFVWAWVGLVAVLFRLALDHLPSEDRWNNGLGWLVSVVFVLVAVMAGRTLDLVLTMTPGSTLGDASTLAVRHWQETGGVTSDGAARLGALWLAVVLVLVVACVVVILVKKWDLPDWGAASRGKSSRARRSAALRDAAETGTSPSWQWRDAAFAAATVVWLLPLLALVFTSWHDPGAAATRAWWSKPSWFAFGSWDLGDLAFGQAVVPTVIMALVASVLVVALASFAAQALEDMASLPSLVMLGLVLGVAVVPPQVVAGQVTEVFAWGPLTAIPSWPRVLLVHVALAVPLAVVILYVTASDWLSATRNWIMQGSGTEGWQRLATAVAAPWRAVWRDPGDETQPDDAGGSAPETDRVDLAVVGVAVLVFIQVWNDFVVGLTVGGRDALPLSVHLFGQTRQFVYNSGPMAAASVVAALVPLIVLALAASTSLRRRDASARPKTQLPSRMVS